MKKSASKSGNPTWETMRWDTRPPAPRNSGAGLKLYVCCCGVHVCCIISSIDCTLYCFPIALKKAPLGYILNDAKYPPPPSPRKYRQTDAESKTLCCSSLFVSTQKNHRFRLPVLSFTIRSLERNLHSCISFHKHIQCHTTFVTPSTD